MNRLVSGPIMAVMMSQILAVAGCGKTAPVLPPNDSMDFLEFKKGNADALTSADQTASNANVDLAVASVGFVVIAVNLYLALPRTVFWGLALDKPSQDGDAWVWNHTFPLMGFEAEMRATEGNNLEIKTTCTGLKAELQWIQDFVYFTGSHAADSGVWRLFDPGTQAAPGPSEPVVTIEWQRASATDKSVLFTNTTPGSAKNGDTLAFALDGTIATMSLHDAVSMTGPVGNQVEDGPAKNFIVAWNVGNGSGKLTRVTTDVLCWDTLAAGQVDIACPTGEWPLP
jgi:hypothetical protein